MGTRTLIAKLALSPMSSLRIVRPSSLLCVRSLTASPFLRLPIVGCDGVGDSPHQRGFTLSPHGLSQAMERFIIWTPVDDCDSEHWLVFLEPSEPSLTRDQINVSYIKTLAEVLGSEEEAKKSIYSVYHSAFAFGCIVSEELSDKIKTLPKVRQVLPDPFLNLPRPFLDLSEWIEWPRVKTEVRDNPRDRYFQMQSKSVQKYHEDGLIRDIDIQIWDFKVRGSPRKKQFILEANEGYQGEGQGYQARNLGGSMPGGSGYHTNNYYQGHGPGCQDGAPGYGGDASGNEGGGAGPVHGQTGGSSSYQVANFQTDGPGYHGIPNCQAYGPYYQGRDLVKEVMAVTLKQVGQLRASWARLPRKPRLSG